MMKWLQVSGVHTAGDIWEGENRYYMFLLFLSHGFDAQERQNPSVYISYMRCVLPIVMVWEACEVLCESMGVRTDPQVQQGGLGWFRTPRHFLPGLSQRPPLSSSQPAAYGAHRFITAAGTDRRQSLEGETETRVRYLRECWRLMRGESEQSEGSTLYFLSGGPFFTGAATCKRAEGERAAGGPTSLPPGQFEGGRTLSIRSLGLCGGFLSVIMNSSCCLFLSSSQRCRASWYWVRAASWMTWSRGSRRDGLSPFLQSVAPEIKPSRRPET